VPKPSPLYLGIMSGTSLDGVDVVLADFGDAAPKLIANHHIGFDPALRLELLALNQPTTNEFERGALAANRLARLYAQAIQELLVCANISAADISAIGCHGQTVRHRPELGYTLQLNNPALIAELSGITVIADFRSRDIAAGGQGAPLVPAFHAAAFKHPSKHRIIVNIGGIANLTNLPVHGDVTGFDCGPGNMLLDAWCAAHSGHPYDANGAWSASGSVIPTLLDALLQDAYFARHPPKSTGRDLFHLGWLNPFLRAEYTPRDVQATLIQLTVKTIFNAINQYCHGAQEVFVCGGGGRNGALMNSLRDTCDKNLIPVALTDTLGVPAEQVEALAFAWLARQAVQGEAGNLPSVTGARHPCILGAIYPAD
jgi:anhydro-N-acetylmuramic acid kinase